MIRTLSRSLRAATSIPGKNGNVSPNERGCQARAMAGGEEEAAKRAAQEGEQNDTIFGKIVRGDIPADVVYSDDKALAFRDINPQAPVHLVVIPKERGKLSRMANATEDQQEILGHLMVVAAKVAKKEGLENGYR